MTVIRFTHHNDLEYAPCMAEYVIACLAMSGRDMAKMPSSIGDLIASLRESGTADAGNCLYNPSRYNPEVTKIAEGPDSYRKPEIEIHVEMTKKGNLSVKWYPLHHFTSGILETDCKGHVTNSSFLYFSEVGDNW